jgi:hypothetical protein
LGSLVVDDWEPLRGAPLQTLYAPSNRTENIQALSTLPLRRLELGFKTVLDSDLSGLCLLSSTLTHLSLWGCFNNKHLQPLAALTRLTRLSCWQYGQRQTLVDLAFVKSMKSLCSLSLTAAQCTNTDALSGLPLTRLRLAQCDDVRGLAGLPLKTLFLTQQVEIHLAPLKKCPLRFLRLPMCILDAGQLQCLSTLTELEIEQLDALHLSSLQHLRLSRLSVSKYVEPSLEPFRNLPLITLLLPSCRPDDLSPLVRMPLRKLSFSRNTSETLDLRPLLTTRDPHRLKLRPKSLMQRFQTLLTTHDSQKVIVQRQVLLDDFF